MRGVGGINYSDSRMAVWPEMELRLFHPTDEASIRRTLTAEGWTLDQIEGQLQAIREMAKSDSGLAVVAENEDGFSGFLSAQLYSWNRLIQIHGLAVVPGSRGQGIGSLLLGAAERFARATGARGVYVDTPVDNEAARGRAPSHRAVRKERHRAELSRRSKAYSREWRAFQRARILDAER